VKINRPLTFLFFFIYLRNIFFISAATYKQWIKKFVVPLAKSSTTSQQPNQSLNVKSSRLQTPLVVVEIKEVQGNK
jgi:hypothetical protein